VLHEELPQVFAVFTVVFECGVMFAEMLGDCFIASLLQGSPATSAGSIGKEDIAMIRSGRYKKYEPSDAAKKIAPKDRIKAADAAVKRAKDTPL
jgi:hypothetical protein